MLITLKFTLGKTTRGMSGLTCCRAAKSKPAGCLVGRLVQRSFTPGNLLKYHNCPQVPETSFPLQTQRLTENRAIHIPQPVMHKDTCSSELADVSNLASHTASPIPLGGSIRNPMWKLFLGYTEARTPQSTEGIHKSVFTLFSSPASP